jgi:hypothetical protein
MKIAPRNIDVGLLFTISHWTYETTTEASESVAITQKTIHNEQMRTGS